MTPTQEDHEAAARRRANHLHEHLVGSAHTPDSHLGCGGCNAIRGEMNRVAREHDCAAALSEAVRVAVEKDRDRIARMVRRELDAVMNLDIAIRSDAQATPAPDWPPNAWTPPETGEKEKP